jgi:hypothetical protein
MGHFQILGVIIKIKMGISDTLLNAKVGHCSTCNAQYVISAEILADDSHIRVNEKYACPKCKSDKPNEVIRAEGDSLKFAREQLNDRLYWREPDGLEILSSED